MPDVPWSKILYRVLSWGTLAALVVTLLLILRKSPPPEVPNDPAAAARIEQKFIAAEQARAAGQPAEVHLDRTELNSYLAQNLELEGSAPANTAAASGAANPDPAAGAPAGGAAPGRPAGNQPTVEEVRSTVKDVKIGLEGDLVKAYVVFDFHGKDLSLELDGRLGSQDGYLKFQPVAGRFGSLPLPQSALDSAVQQLMASPENREKLRLPPDISRIQIVNGELVISYQ
ncbi:MAG: hypothetical protein LAN59_05530 [Acidobacteriia bacterium]|nr:hypothetical protein [Terriglobia bacterium]